MHWLKYAKLNRKDRLKNMPSTTLEVVMLDDVSRAYRSISNVLQCVTGPLLLDVLASEWSTNR